MECLREAPLLHLPSLAEIHHQQHHVAAVVWFERHLLLLIVRMFVDFWSFYECACSELFQAVGSFVLVGRQVVSSTGDSLPLPLCLQCEYSLLIDLGPIID